MFEAEVGQVILIAMLFIDVLAVCIEAIMVYKLINTVKHFNCFIYSKYFSITCCYCMIAQYMTLCSECEQCLAQQVTQAVSTALWR